MKRGLLLFVLLSSLVYAQVNVPYDSTYPEASGVGVTRYTDFPLDNIHILRLQDAAFSLGGNVSELREQVNAMEARRSGEIADLKNALDGFQRSIVAQVGSLQSSVDASSPRPSFESPVTVEFPDYVVVLLGLILFLLIFLIVLVLYKREGKEDFSDHIHPAPPEVINYVRNQFSHKKSIHDIRMELASRGWTPGVIEHAIHAAKEK